MGMEVLIVDDEPHIRLLVEETLEDLEDEGVDLITAKDGDEALEAIKKHLPKVVVMDIMMPGKDGFEVCSIVKKELKLPNIQIILLTARGQSYDYERAKEVECDLYLTKPFEPDDLLNHVRERLGLN